MTDRLRLSGKIRPSDELNYYNLYNYMHDHNPDLGSCVQGAYEDTGRLVSVEEGAPLMSVSPDNQFGVAEYAGDDQLYHYRAQGWYQLTTPEQIRSEIDHRGSVTAIIKLFDSWNDFYGMGPYIPSPREQSNGEYHMVSLVGYDNTDRTWIVRNSYGTNWGSRGFVKVKQTDQKLDVLGSVFAPIL
jgi:C1A family cysteine protease